MRSLSSEKLLLKVESPMWLGVRLLIFFFEKSRKIETLIIHRSFQQNRIFSLRTKQSSRFIVANVDCIGQLLHVEKCVFMKIDDFEDVLPDHIEDGFRKTWLYHRVSSRAQNFVRFSAVKFHFLTSFPSEGRKLFPREVHPWVAAPS